MAALQLTRESWQQDINFLCADGKLPHQLANALKGLIGTYLSDHIRPTVNDGIAKLFKEYLSDGIWIDKKFYVIVFFVPTESNYRQIAELVPWYSKGGRMVQIQDMP